jgi:VanZ family protein
MCLLTATAILGLALIPAPPAAIDTGWDKANHGLAFAVLALWAQGGWVSRWRWAWLLGLGIAIEALQALTPPREPSAADVLADAVGLVIAWGLARGWSRFRSPATPD